MARKNYSNQFEDLLPDSKPKAEKAAEEMPKQPSDVEKSVNKANKSSPKTTDTSVSPSEPVYEEKAVLPTEISNASKTAPKTASTPLVSENIPEPAPAAAHKGFSLNIPVKMARTSNTRSFYIPDDLYEALVEQGKQRNMSVSVFLTEILDQIFTS